MSLKEVHEKIVPLEVDRIKSKLIKCLQKESKTSCATFMIASLHLYIDLSVQLGVLLGRTLPQIKKDIFTWAALHKAESLIENLYNECIENVNNNK